MSSDNDLFAQCKEAMFPPAATVAELRKRPAVLRRVLQHLCESSDYSLKQGAAVPFAPIWIAAVMNGPDRMVGLREALQACGSSMCGRTMNARDPAFRCLDCAADPTCVMCAHCFQRSPCRFHNHRMHPGGGGMCDCGDPTVWKREGFCSDHGGGGDGTADPTDALPGDLKAWVAECLEAAARFVVRCTNAAIVEAGTDAETAGLEPLVGAATKALAMLSDFASISDASRRLVANAFAASAVVADVPTVPEPPGEAIAAGGGSVFEQDGLDGDEDDEGAAINGGDDVDFDDLSSDASSTADAGDDDDADAEQPRRRHRDPESTTTTSSLVDHLSARAASTSQARATASSDDDDDARAAALIGAVVHRFTLLDQLFLLGMATPTKSAAALIKKTYDLLTGVSIDFAFRREYLRSYSATAWHYAVSDNNKGTLKRSKRKFRKTGKLHELAVQVLTVGPIVNEALIPADPNAPTILSAMLGSQLINLASTGRRLHARDIEFVVHRTQARRQVPMASLHHLKYAFFTSHAPKVLLAVRPLFRAFCVLEGARQGSDYQIERTTDRRDLDTDMWDFDAMSATTSWALHDVLKTAVARIVARSEGCTTTTDALELPAEYQRNDISLAPPSALDVKGFSRLVLRCLATPRMPEEAAAARHEVEWVADLKRCFGDLFADMGETLLDICSLRASSSSLQMELVVRVQQQQQQQQQTSSTNDADDDVTDAFTVVRHEERERRIDVPRFSILANKTPFTFHMPLTRTFALLTRAVVEGSTAKFKQQSGGGSGDDDDLVVGGSLLRSLIAECLGGPSEAACESERMIPQLLDATVAPYLQTSQYIDQLWRTDYCGVHKHTGIYHQFQPGHFVELDLLALQLLTATYGAGYVAAQMLLRFTYHDDAVSASVRTGGDARAGETTTMTRPGGVAGMLATAMGRGRGNTARVVSPATPSATKQQHQKKTDEVSPGHWHFLRLMLAIATDDSKTSVKNDFRGRVVHALARRQLRRSDLERVVSTFETEDDNKVLARGKAIDGALKSVAVVEKRREGNVYRLKPESWNLVNPYFASWTPFDVESAVEAHELQTRAHYSKVAAEQGKAFTKPPRRPAVFTSPDHAGPLKRVVETLHTVPTLAVALEAVLLRASRVSAKAPGISQPTAPHLMAALDAFTAAFATAKQLPGCKNLVDSAAPGIHWGNFEKAIARIRATATWSPPTIHDKLRRALPVDIGAGTDGLLHKVLLGRAYTSVVFGGNPKRLPGGAELTGLQALRKLAEEAEERLDDVPTHYVAQLHGIVRDLEASVTDAEAAGVVVSTTGGADADAEAAERTPDVGATKAALVDPEEAAAAKKKALKNRQAALMAKLRKKQASSIATAQESMQSNLDAGGRDQDGRKVDGGDDNDQEKKDAKPPLDAQEEAEADGELLQGLPSGMSVMASTFEEQSTTFHLGDCTAAFETMECVCAFCQEPSTQRKPLAFMGQTSASNTLSRVFESQGEEKGPATAHVNFCGHMAHLECFARRIGHLSRLRTRGDAVGDNLQAFLRGYHFKGMRYLTDNESLCPVCSRAVSALCPSAAARRPVDSGEATAFITSLARNVAGRPIGSALSLVHLANFAEESIGRGAFSSSAAEDDSTPTMADVVTTADHSGDLQPVLEALAALQTTAQQVTIEAVSAAAGRMTTLRSFSGLNALVQIVSRSVGRAVGSSARNKKLLRELVRSAVAAKAPHALALASIAARCGARNDPDLEQLAEDAASQRRIVPEQLVDPDAVSDADLFSLEVSPWIRTAALLRMLLHHRPLPSQQAELAEAATMDDVVNKVTFSGLDASSSSALPKEADCIKLRALAAFALKMEMHPKVFAAFNAPPPQRAAATEEGGEEEEQVLLSPAAEHTAALSARFRAHLPDAFVHVAHRVFNAPCSVCESTESAKVVCMDCGELLCARASAKPELRDHADVCGYGTAIFLEVSTSRLVVVQSVNGRAATLAPLHVDTYGEADAGLTRGMPLFLSPERVAEMTLPWLRCAWDHQTQILHTNTWKISADGI